MLKKLETRWNVIVISLAVLILAIGCSSSKEIELDVSANGSQIEIEQGQTLVITLAGNPTTGYTWEMVEQEGQILQQVGETEFQAESDLIGAPGVQILRFEAVDAGQMTLELVYHQPWEEDVEPAETFSVQVTVR